MMVPVDRAPPASPGDQREELELVRGGVDQPAAGAAHRMLSAIAPPLTLTRSMSGSMHPRQDSTTDT